MMDIEYTNGQDPKKIILADSWTSLPEELSNPSFFAYHPEQEAILDYFVNSVKAASTSQLDKLLASTLLNKSPVSLPSFLARAWTTVSYPTRVRVTALNRFTQLSATSNSYDFQGFIPHLVVALSDNSKEIRSAAATVITTLDTHYRSSDSSQTTVIGLTDLYVEDTLKWLSPSTAKWLVEDILSSKLEECSLDCNYVVRLLGAMLNGAGKKGKKEQYFLYLGSNNRNPTAVMVCLASHVVCSATSAVQFFLLRILNDSCIEATQAIKLKAQSLQAFLERCQDLEFVSSLLNKEPQIPVAEFENQIVQIVGPGSGTAQIAILLDFVRSAGPLATAACQQLAVVFSTTGQNTQLQIVKSLFDQLENGPAVCPLSISLISGHCKDSIIDNRFDCSSNCSYFIITRRC
jgi:hypothetical protein